MTTQVLNVLEVLGNITFFFGFIGFLVYMINRGRNDP